MPTQRPPPSLRCHLKDSEENESCNYRNTPNPRCHRSGWWALKTQNFLPLFLFILRYFVISAPKKTGAAAYTHYAIYAHRAESALVIHNLALKNAPGVWFLHWQRHCTFSEEKTKAVSFPAQPHSDFLSAAVVFECIPLHPALLLWEGWPGNSGAQSQRISMDPS